MSLRENIANIVKKLIKSLTIKFPMEKFDKIRINSKPISTRGDTEQNILIMATLEPAYIKINYYDI